jgi:DNA-binding beta-propeller fold protein YncE
MNNTHASGKRTFCFSAIWILYAAAAPSTSYADIAVSANDNKVTLVKGITTVVANPPPDTITIIDLKSSKPSVVVELEAPASVVGPPLSVALTPDESLALVTSAMKIDPADPTKQIPDNRVSVIDLKSSPPKVIATLEAGLGAAGVSINRQGNLALVANRNEGTVSVFSIKGKEIAKVDTIKLGDDKSGPSHAAFTPDGKSALVTRDGDHLVSLLTISDGKVEFSKRDISAGLRPYGLAISSTGKFAVVANVGRGGGDVDTVSLIDMTLKPVRAVDIITVGQTPEGIMLSPDNKFCAVVLHNGSAKAKDSPFYNDFGKLVVLRVNGMKLSKVAEAPIGHWSQGVAFSADGKTVLVQNMIEKDVQVFSFNGKQLKDTKQRLPLKGGGAAIRTAEKP